MSGIPTGGAPAPVKTREEMLQEWREQRAAKLATQTSNGKALASSQASFSRMPPGSGAPGKENWPAPAQAGKVAAREGADGFSSLAARLESLKRESLRPSIAPTSSAPSQAGVQFEPAGQVDTTVLRRLATQLFEDESWKQLYEKGMNAQLTRSKDGATEGTKIKELAGIVKLLRRALKELQGRTESFVEQSCRFERDIGQQVEATKLSSESGTMAAQAELANARREAAAATAAHKNALAQWKGEMDVHQAECARLRRENERLQAETGRLTGELRRCEAQRAQGQEAAQQAQRAAAAAAKDAAARQAALERQVRELRVAQESAELAARQEAARLAGAAAEQGRALEEARGRVTALQRDVAAAAQEGARAREAAAAATTRCGALEAELTAHRAVHERVVADAAAVLTELQEWQTRAADLSAELAQARQEVSLLDAELKRTTGELDRAGERERDLKSALERGDKEIGGLRAEVATAHGELESLKQTHTELQAERDGHVASLREAEAAREQAQEEASVLKRDLESLQSEHATLQESSAKLQQLKETAESAAQAATLRLERLESELSALQECTVGLTGESGTDSREMVARLLSRVGALEAAVAESESKRRALHNALVELKGNIRVFCRVRPSTGGAGSGSVACAADGAGVRVADDAGREHEFRFDRVFRPDASQAAVYAEVSDLVQSALDGYKVCLFSYGQTGAGKTHTMQGTSQLGEGAGIIPRAARQILAAAAALRERGYEYSLEATFVEVYNETLRDLLAGKGARLPDGNAIQHPADGGHTVVLGATRMPVADEADVADVLARAAAARSVEATAMNATSSRSHSVFTLNITGVHAASDAVLRGSLSLVDLAGSERLARSGAEGARAKEACSINRSLSALGDVFQALAARAAHVPYRNSKLTHLLQPCLGGSGKTLMFVNVNPDPASAGETLCSLRFAAKVNAVDTAAKGGAARHVSSLAETGARAVAEAKRKAAGAGVSAGAAGRAVRSRGAL